MIEQIQHRRAERATRRLLKSYQGKPEYSKEVDAILAESDKFDEVVDECIAEQQKNTGGAFSDMIGMLIQSFIDDPEKWIALIIKLFA